MTASPSGGTPPLLERPELRVEGVAKVTGTARFAADHRMPGMLEAAYARSPYPHARIVRIDTAPAGAMPGVRAVITGAEVRPARFGRWLLDWPVLCWDRVRFIGDRVAAVAAETRAQADAAAMAIQVEYEELPPILEPADALRPDAPTLHPDADKYLHLAGERPARSHPNMQGVMRHEHGDVDAAFRQAARVFEHTFHVGRVGHGYIEPRAAVVWIDGDSVRVVSTNKGPFALREQLALSLGVASDKIVVESLYVGGDFGGKGLSPDEFALYFLARATGRPVRAMNRYADDLQATNTRHRATLRLRTGIDENGRIVAHEAHVVMDGGAYAAGKPTARLIPGESLSTLAGYAVPNARLEALTVYTNNVPAGNARAPGHPQSTFAKESHIDAIAREIGADPLEFRRRNAIKPGDVDVGGERWGASSIPEFLDEVAKASDWGAALPADHGRGIAFNVRHVGSGNGTVRVSLAADGSAEVVTAVPDQGGGAYTMLQRIVAAELALPLDRVTVSSGTTAEVLPDAGVGGSRVTPVVGGAALDGARRLKARIEAGEAPPISEVGKASLERHAYGMCAYVIDVSVDRATGQFRIERVVIVADVGTVINPVALRGQLEGGFVFGLGQSTLEDLRTEDGRVVAPNLNDYKLPTMGDVPLDVRIVLTGAPGPGPFGAKSVGELGNPAVGPAIANAIADAVGARLTATPLTAEAVLDRLS